MKDDVLSNVKDIIERERERGLSSIWKSPFSSSNNVDRAPRSDGAGKFLSHLG